MSETSEHPLTDGGVTASGDRRLTGHEVVRALRTSLHDIAGSAIPRGSRCALLNFPSYANVGDSAIWLGQRELLRARNADVVYTCDVFDYRPRVLERRIRDGIVLLKGGGAFGDRYPEHQDFTERVVADFPDNAIVQLPQSVEFRDGKRAERTASALARHEGLTLFLRDEQSLERIRELGLNGRLCPDAAFALDRLERERAPSEPVVWLARTDGEQSQDAPDGLPTVDWARDDAVHRMLHHLPLLRWRWREHLAQGRLRRGNRLLSGGHVVVTDRLHGHILALLLGIPHVLLDTANSKMRNFFDTWTKECALTHWSDDVSEAHTLADRLATSA